MLLRVLLVALCFFTSFNTLADKRFLKSFPSTNPLSYQYVKSMIQDRQGFMWFGTQDGLHRFDGYDFKSYHHDAQQPDSLSADTISALLIDKQGQLWVATRGGGISIYQEASDTFIHLNTSLSEHALSNDNVNALLQDSQGNIWAGTESGLNKITKHDDSYVIEQFYQQLGNRKSLSTNIITSLTETSAQEIWVGTSGGGISIFSVEGQFLRHTSLPLSNKPNETAKLISSMRQDNRENIWIGTLENGLFQLNKNGDVERHYYHSAPKAFDISSNNIEDIFEDSSKQLWVATDQGFLVKSNESSTFNAYRHTNNPYSLNNDFVLSFYEDSDNMMWIGTYSGVNRWDPLMTTFNQYNAALYPQLAEDIVTGFAQDNAQRLVFSTYSSGLFALSLSDNGISQLPISEYFKDMRIMTLFSDGEYLWVGTRTKGAYRLTIADGTINKYVHSTTDSNTISANSITDIYKDQYGQMWIATYHQGLNRLNQDGSVTRYIKRDDDTNKGPSSNHILQIQEDALGNIWLATYGGGLNKFDPQTETFTHLLHDDNDATSISSNLAWILHVDDSNNLWVGTQSSGVNILSADNIKQQRYQFQHIGVKDGLKSRTIYAINQDRHGKMWFSSNRGISSYTPHTKVIQHFDASHGLEDLEYNHGSAFRSRNKTLYFGSSKGFVGIDPSQTNPPREVPNIQLVDIFSLNESIKLDRSLHQVRQLTFDYDERLISFNYVGLNYSEPSTTRYKYRLLGFDKEWIDAGASRRATYTNLPHGDYQFQVMATSDGIAWSQPQINLHITVNSAPWNTWWAYLIYTLVIVVVLLSYTRFINRKVQIEQQKKQELALLVKEKTEKFVQKNDELAAANKQLEALSTIDEKTGLYSRTYLDIYIEQSTKLLAQFHRNILPIQRQLLPRLYTVMVKLKPEHSAQLLAVSELLSYSRNTDDLLVKWSQDSFIIIGYEKDDNARELAQRLSQRLNELFSNSTTPAVSYTFYPFDVENPIALNWDQINVLTELAGDIVDGDLELSWLGLYSPKSQPFDYLRLLQSKDKQALFDAVRCKYN
ncbi:two-component regulator propeller domain-containing protein [Psychrobium sp. MM17-31]|uniref:ligand-binding sensor domain-containing protein n=1 Tax=Psychrobium sp. MM17-31 TaxID=2917758 RepID=UPI0031B9C6D5